MRANAVLVLCLVAVSAVPSSPHRIVGGTLTTINEYPTITALLFSYTSSNYRQGCGGAILNFQSVMTAAHCTEDEIPEYWRVRVGSTYANSGGAVHNTATIINHPNYNPRTLDCDISIIRVWPLLQFINNQVQPCLIPSPNYNLLDNEMVYAAGWGTTSVNGPASEQLRHVQIWTVNQNVCRERYASVGEPITDNMLCSGWLDVGGRDQCQGDSGGPLYHNGVVVGVCSWGRGCAQAFFPGVNARVSRFTPWIQSNA